MRPAATHEVDDGTAQALGVDMGIFGAARGRAGGRGRQARFVPMAPGEREVARQSALYRPNSQAVDGDFVVTTMRLVFTPNTSHDATRAISWVLDRPGDPDGVHIQAEQVRGTVREHGFGRLAEFDHVRAGRSPSRSCPPTLVVTDMVGIETEVGILASRTSAAGRTENAGARDRMLGEIVALLPQMH